MVGFEKAFGAVKVIKDQIQYRSKSLLNLARDYFSNLKSVKIPILKICQRYEIIFLYVVSNTKINFFR